MTQNPPKSLPLPDPAEGTEVPAVAALARPQSLKNWSQDLLGILESQKESVFADWNFREDRLTRADWMRITKKMTGCGSVVELRAKVDQGTGEVSSPELHAANFCGQHQICPFCAGRVQDRRKARFRDPIMAAAREYSHAYLVTATIPPVPTWREDLAFLLDSWKRFRKMGQVRSGRKKARSSGEWSKIRAGISKVEIKRGDDSGLPHCHVHALFFTNEILDFRVWSKDEKAKPRAERESLFENNGSKIAEEWNRATEGRAKAINVKKIKWRAPKRFEDESDKEYSARAADWSWSDSVYAQAREVLKYATKFDSHPEAGSEALFARDFLAIKSAAYGRRLFQTYGAFRNVGGSDLTGSTCPLSSRPVIYEARWRTDRYSELRERSKPVFSNREPGPMLTHRLRVLNRVQGMTRRIRRAINEAKERYFKTGELSPALLERRQYLDEGGFKDTVEAMELPGYVAEAPAELATWEKWIDQATEGGRIAYSQARADLDEESHMRQVGTVEERQFVAAAERKWFWHLEGYDQYVNRLFIEVLAASPPPR